jgi:hypothetical protein
LKPFPFQAGTETDYLFFLLRVLGFADFPEALLAGDLFPRADFWASAGDLEGLNWELVLLATVLWIMGCLMEAP